VFSVDPTDSPIDWLDSDHVICVYCRSVGPCAFRCYISKVDRIHYELRVSRRSDSRRIFSSEVPDRLKTK
jgi:hypothetical protein